MAHHHRLHGQHPLAHLAPSHHIAAPSPGIVPVTHPPPGNGSAVLSGYTVAAGRGVCIVHAALPAVIVPSGRIPWIRRRLHIGRARAAGGVRTGGAVAALASRRVGRIETGGTLGEQARRKHYTGEKHRHKPCNLHDITLLEGYLLLLVTKGG
ncbi:MAG: hypothetical protein IT210_00435 [Armatimonadetes bacterium]|nr:hypothetical protein [Armatimonadota bacterium]